LSRALGAAGYTEGLSPVFVARPCTTRSAPGRRRSAAARGSPGQPALEAEPELRTSLLPGLLATAAAQRRAGDARLALFEMGLVYLPRPDAKPAPIPSVEHRPSDEEIAAMYAAVPPQPRHAAVVLAGEVERSGWWGEGRTASWADAVQAARIIAEADRTELTVRNAEHAPWHPGRCAELVLQGDAGEIVVGYAGELHPRVIAALELPPRTAAMELDLDAFGRRRRPRRRTSRRSRRSCSTSRWSCRPTCRRRRCATPVREGAGSCSSRSGSSTCSPMPSAWAPTASRWRSRCASGRRIEH